MERLFFFDNELKNKDCNFIKKTKINLKKAKINYEKTEYEYFIKNLKKPEYIFSKSPLLSNENHWPNNNNTKNKKN